MHGRIFVRHGGLRKARILVRKPTPREKMFLRDQLEEMKKYKWIESEKAGRDLGDAAIIDWIHLYAAEFRRIWESIHGRVIEEIDGIYCSGCERACPGA